MLPCRRAEAVPIGEPVAYRVPMVQNARRFGAGHRIRLLLCSDDQPREIPTIMGFRHAPEGTSSRNTVYSSSRLGGPSTALALAIFKRWSALVTPAVLLGVLGYATGNYIGVAMAYLIRLFTG